MGESSMGESEEVSEKDRSGYQQQGEQGGEILRLKSYPQGENNAIDNQGVVDDSSTGLVEELMEVEVNDTCDEQEKDEGVEDEGA